MLLMQEKFQNRCEIFKLLDPCDPYTAKTTPFPNKHVSGSERLAQTRVVLQISCQSARIGTPPRPFSLDIYVYSFPYSLSMRVLTSVIDLTILSSALIRPTVSAISSATQRRAFSSTLYRSSTTFTANQMYVELPSHSSQPFQARGFQRCY